MNERLEKLLVSNADYTWTALQERLSKELAQELNIVLNENDYATIRYYQGRVAMLRDLFPILREEFSRLEKELYGEED